MSAMSSNLRGTNSVSSTRGLLMPIRGVSFAELQHAGYQPVELLETERLGWSMWQSLILEQTWILQELTSISYQ